MQDNTTRISIPLMPYEFTVPYGVDIYDKLPYTMDYDLCTRTGITLQSGNVVKAYHYMTSDTFEVGNDIESIGA